MQIRLKLSKFSKCHIEFWEEIRKVHFSFLVVENEPIIASCRKDKSVTKKTGVMYILYSSVDVLAYANVNMFILGFSSRTTSGKYGQPNNAEEDYR